MKLILIGPAGVGKSTLAQDLKIVLIKYGVDTVISFNDTEAVRIVKPSGLVEWTTK